MINIKFGVRKENLEILKNIIDEGANYGIWELFYGEETVEIVQKLKNIIGKLNNDIETLGSKAVQLELDFNQGQTLKKIVIFYLNKNFQTMTTQQFETISDFILFVDDGMEEE